jgi:O-antigen ligase
MGLTFSRGVLIGLAIMLLVMLFLRYVKFYQVLLVVVILYALTQAVPQVGGRLVKLQNLSLSEMLSSDSSQTGLEEADGSTQNRVAQQLTALRMFLDYPILGVGTGFYAVNYQEYAKLVGMKVKNENRESHTLYLGLAAENGLLGLGCYLTMIYVTLRNLKRIRQRWLTENPQLANLAIAFFLAIVGYLGTAIFLHLAYVRFFWLIMGLAGAAYQISQRAAATQFAPVRVEQPVMNDSSPLQGSNRRRLLRRNHQLRTGS